MLMILLALALALAYPVELDLDLIKGETTQRDLLGQKRQKLWPLSFIWIRPLLDLHQSLDISKETHFPRRK
jgi:hypothetical protein